MSKFERTKSEESKAAREIEGDVDEKRWKERLKRVAKAKDVAVPAPKGPLRSKPSSE